MTMFQLLYLWSRAATNFKLGLIGWTNFIWRSKWCFWPKDLSQLSHLNFFSWSWITEICLFKDFATVNFFPHKLHWWDSLFSALWTVFMWFLKFFNDDIFLPHISHLRSFKFLTSEFFSDFSNCSGSEIWLEICYESQDQNSPTENRRFNTESS